MEISSEDKLNISIESDSDDEFKRIKKVLSSMEEEEGEISDDDCIDRNSTSFLVIDSEDELSEGLRALVKKEEKNEVAILEEKLISNIRKRFHRLRKSSKSKNRKKDNGKSIWFHCVIPQISQGIKSMITDGFTVCFRARPVERWNYNALYMVIYVLGVLFRYLIVFLFRGIIFLIGTLFFAIAVGWLKIWSQEKYSEGKTFRRLVKFYSGVWILSIGGVCKIHGTPPQRKKNQIFVSNHTTLLDYAFLLNHYEFSTVGQKHNGFSGWFQTIVSPLKGIWFERFEEFDRKIVQMRILQHIGDLQNPPLLIFPEGTCVNNEYIIMFKKGVFELEDVTVCPIAIKYNKLFSDPFWDSRNESFLWHVLRLMVEWCTFCEIHFLESMKKGAEETPTEFSKRVKKSIASKIKIKDVVWDGYLKYYSPSERIRNEKRKLFAESMKAKMRRFDTPFEPFLGTQNGKKHNMDLVPQSI